MGSVAEIGVTGFFDIRVAFFSVNENECLSYPFWREIVSYFLIKKECVQRVPPDHFLRIMSLEIRTVRGEGRGEKREKIRESIVSFFC